MAVQLRLRGTFIDFCMKHEDLECFGNGSRVRSRSSPPALPCPVQEAMDYESCANQYLQDLVSRTLKLSSSPYSSDKDCEVHPVSSQDLCELPTEARQWRSGSELRTWQASDSIKSPVASKGSKSAVKLQGAINSEEFSLDQKGPVTTLMIRNIPCKLTLKALIMLFDSAGFAGTYDFLHLPGRGHRFSNLGYAFINFCNPATVGPFISKFNSIAFSEVLPINTKKVIDIRVAEVQGLEPNIAKVHHTMPKDKDNGNLMTSYVLM